MRNSEGTQFILSALEFEAESLRIKLKYLRELKLKAEQGNKQTAEDPYEKYFGSLKAKFS